LIVEHDANEDGEEDSQENGDASDCHWLSAVEEGAGAV